MQICKGSLRQFIKSSRATALPVSFLMLFASLIIIISATYYVSVTKIQARGKLLNIRLAELNMLSFEESVSDLSWSPGSSNVYHFEDLGGSLYTDPSAKHLIINVTDSSFYTIAYNDTIGKITYNLPSAEIVVSKFYFKGDKRAVINQSTFTTAQLHIAPGTPSPQITLTYRPLATISETGFSDGKPVNTLRLYITSLNSSDIIATRGEFSIKSTCINVASNLQTHNLTYPINSISVEATFDDRNDTVVLPVSSNEDGAFLRIETLVCAIKLEKVVGGS